MKNIANLLLKHQLIPAEKAAEMNEKDADNDELVADFMTVYDAYKAGTLDTNAKIGAEIKKAFVRQANRDARAVAREAAKAKRIADRKAAAKAARKS